MHTGHALQGAALVSLFAILLTQPGYTQEVPLRPPEITAAGHGQGRATPTSAVLLISVTTKAPTAAQAASENATRSSSAVSALRAAGLASEDVTTAGYMVSQNYEFPGPALADSRVGPGQRVPAGFIARNTIRGEVRRIPDLGKVIDVALAAGATEIAGVQFVSSSDESARRDATAAAVREARSNAEVIARAAGGTLGRLISLGSGEAPRDYSYESYARIAGGVAATQILPPNLMISAQVFGRWEFIPAPSR